MNELNLFLRILMGVGLSAACGFKVFVPLLVMSIAAVTGNLELADNFTWIGTNTVLVIFIVAVCVESIAYFIPGFDNLLDLVATPAAAVAASIITASFLFNLSPTLQWTLAIIAGTSMAEPFQLSTVGVRGMSTATTGGLGNPIIAILETIMAVIISLLAIIFPLSVVLIIIVLVYLLIKFLLPKLN